MTFHIDDISQKSKREILEVWDEAVKHMDAQDKRIAELETKVNIMEVLAEERRQFIVNGVELGYISLPDCEVDSANDTFARCNLENEYALNNFKLEQQAKGVEALAYSMLFRGHLENTLDRCEVLDRANEIREQAKQLKEQPNV